MGSNSCRLGFGLLLIIVARAVASGQDIQGTVTAGRSQPLAGVVVRIETPGQSQQTTTDRNGRFKVTGLHGERLLVSVLQGENLVYRAIRPVKPGQDLVIALTAIYEAPAGFDPLAVAAVRGPEVFVADRTGGRIHRFQGGLFEQTVASGERLNDLAALTRPDGPALFGCVGFDLLVRFDRTGHRTKTWFGPGSLRNCNSVAVDPLAGHAFVSNARENAIYIFLNGDQTPSPHSTLTAFQVKELGAMAVDPTASNQPGRLFVADAADGRIFAIRLDNRKVTQFAHGLGHIQALAVDGPRRRLYAVGGGNAWQLDLREPVPAAARFPGSSKLQAPSAIAVDSSDGAIYIGDSKRKALLVFSPQGELRSSTDGR